MNFQGSLGSSLKTKEELYKERLAKERQWDESYIEACAIDIENIFLDMAARGEYELVDGEKKLECLFATEDDSPYLDISESCIEEGPDHQNKKITTVQYSERHSFFINELERLLAEDNISIINEYLAQTKFDNRHGGIPFPIAEWFPLDYPAVYQGGFDRFSIAHHAKIVLQCQTSIPEECSEEYVTFDQANIQADTKGENEFGVEEQTPDSMVDFDSMDGHQFEAFCAELLSKNGFTNVEKTQGSGDQGVDIIAFKDGVKFGVQCKCYSSDVGNKAVQEVFAGKAYYHCHVAVILTNSHFTQYARELAQMNNVVLWDRDKLLEFIEKADK